MRRFTAVLSIVFASICLVGCDASGGQEPEATASTSADPAATTTSNGETATWELVDDDITAASTEVRIGVTRLGCADGETGEVLPAEVTYSETQVIVRADVVALPPGAYTCPGNDVVEVTVVLSEPLGDRELVDAACLTGDAVATSFCIEGAVRWP